MLADRGNRLAAAAGIHRVVAGGLHDIVARAESDRVVAAAGIDLRVATGGRGPPIIAFPGIGRPGALVAPRDDDAIVAAACGDRARTSGRKKGEIPDARQY